MGVTMGQREGLSQSPDYCLQLLFNSKPKTTWKHLKSQLLLKITFSTNPASSAPAGKVKQMVFID